MCTHARMCFPSLSSSEFLHYILPCQSQILWFSVNTVFEGWLATFQSPTEQCFIAHWNLGCLASVEWNSFDWTKNYGRICFLIQVKLLQRKVEWNVPQKTHMKLGICFPLPHMELKMWVKPRVTGQFPKTTLKDYFKWEGESNSAPLIELPGLWEFYVVITLWLRSYVEHSALWSCPRWTAW